MSKKIQIQRWCELSKKQICLVAMIFATAIFNIIDGLLTAYIVGQGKAIEANPICRYLLDQGTWVFLTVKLAITPAILLCALAVATQPKIHLGLKWIIPISLVFLLYLFLVVNGLVILIIMP